jgi:hypothetical protein
MNADVLYNKIIPNEREKSKVSPFIKSNHNMFIIETKKHSSLQNKKLLLHID